MFWSIFNNTVIAKSLLQSSTPSLAPMLEKVIPSVVSISIEGMVKTNSCQLKRSVNYYSDSKICVHKKKVLLQNNLLCNGSVKSNYDVSYHKFHALGSGVIINSEFGYVVTNNHVIENAKKIQVQLNDGRCSEAKVIGRDIRTDIALLKLTLLTNLTAITISNSNLIKVGDYAIAIGNPYGLGETVTSGIISALGRSGLHLENYENFIQTDAAINRGNSGGALVNLKGELIGINTAILAPDGGNIGIGFAIPSNMVQHLTKQIMKYGHVIRGQLGIIGTELTSELAKIMKVNTNHGVFVSQVLSNSSAQKAGIHAGDIIVSVYDKMILNFSSFRTEINSFPINTELDLGILRNGIVRHILVKLKYNFNEKVKYFTNDKILNGVYFCNDYYRGKNIVRVDHVLKDSYAFRIGFKKNDIIVNINNHIINNIKDLKNILVKTNNLFAFLVNRNDHFIYLFLKK
ncbi:Do family serine endopeptidase [Buchnera aphidicola]|uniref:Do family serine endopeptidase n=1 Tax=Buchnera aphidicola TaxID=9 RepID=UPI0034641C51